MKDLFIDNTIASKFGNPMDQEYKKLITWLIEFDPKKRDKCASLMISKKIIKEYSASTINATSVTNIMVIVNQMIAEDRGTQISNDEIKKFKMNNYSKKIRRQLRSNKKDWNHIPLVLLSKRKFALTYDKNFEYDLIHFPGYCVNVQKRPELLNYK
ncbi:hypothetical protein BH10BAC5_BH10BAC5_24940 [soil metagenome]